MHRSVLPVPGSPSLKFLDLLVKTEVFNGKLHTLENGRPGSAAGFWKILILIGILSFLGRGPFTTAVLL